MHTYRGLSTRTSLLCLHCTDNSEFEEMAGSSLAGNVTGYFYKLKNTGQSLNILVIGEPGSGKTSLVNNLLGEEIAEEEAESTSEMCTFKGIVQGVSVTVYEDSSFSAEDENQKGEVQKLILSCSLTFILFCLKMSETRMRQSLIKAFKMFHSIGVNWNKTVIALTFADSLPVPKAQRQDPNFDMKLFFVNRKKEWKHKITEVLTSEVDVPTETAQHINMLPTTGDPDEKLPTGEEWCSAFWSALLPAAMQTAHPSVTTTPDNAYISKLSSVSQPPITHDMLVASGQQTWL